MSLVLDELDAFVARLRRPPVLRACAIHGAKASRSPAAFVEERSISYSAPSSAKLTVSSAVSPVIIVFENDLDALRHRSSNEK